jgi:hypothetical protein
MLPESVFMAGGATFVVASLGCAIARLRLREALTEVVESRRPLTDIALDAGFSSHSHFTDFRTLENLCRVRLCPVLCPPPNLTECDGVSRTQRKALLDMHP